MASCGITAFIESIEQFLNFFVLFKVLFIQLRTIKWRVDQDGYPADWSMVMLHYVDFHSICNEAVCLPIDCIPSQLHDSCLLPPKYDE